MLRGSSAASAGTVAPTTFRAHTPNSCRSCGSPRPGCRSCWPSCCGWRSPGFSDLTGAQRGFYVGGLFLGLSAAALLMAPACCHRLVCGRRLKRELVSMANRCAVAGLGMLLAAVGCAVLLVLKPVVGLRVSSMITALTMLWFGGLWYGVPMMMRRRHQHPAHSLVAVAEG